MESEKGLVYVTRKLHFNAAHKLYNPSWSDEKNFEVFGKCSNPNWHGHNFDLYVTVKGIPSPETGFVINLKVLKDIVNSVIVDKIDHRNINLDVDFMKGKIATIENLAIAMWYELLPHLHGVKLHCIKIYETERQFVEYFGE
ncbi:MAG: 6-carboxytetrahydropterin synthase [Bacteroidia bacterium]|nr:6-carboxytetrahydropterin synthase [Bacteroidia bacterium]